MDSKKFINQYWNHYLILEEDFIKTFRYVTLNKENYNTFSVEYQRLLLSIGSELDIILKIFCDFEGSEHKTMNNYKQKILENSLMRLDNTVSINQKVSDIVIMPFGNGLHLDIPIWWTAYNKVKHNRTDNIQEANLKNTLYSLAGLYLLEEYCYNKFISLGEIDYLDPESKLFNLNWSRKFSSSNKIVLETIGSTYD